MNPPARKKTSILLSLWQAIAQRTRSIVLLGLVCVACSIGGAVLVHYAQHHSYFTATDIVVSTDGTLTSDEIKQWAGVAPGMNTVALDVRPCGPRGVAVDAAPLPGRPERQYSSPALLLPTV